VKVNGKDDAAKVNGKSFLWFNPKGLVLTLTLAACDLKVFTATKRFKKLFNTAKVNG